MSGQPKNKTKTWQWKQICTFNIVTYLTSFQNVEQNKNISEVENHNF